MMLQHCPTLVTGWSGRWEPIAKLLDTAKLSQKPRQAFVVSANSMQSGIETFLVYPTRWQPTVTKQITFRWTETKCIKTPFGVHKSLHNDGTTMQAIRAESATHFIAVIVSPTSNSSGKLHRNFSENLHHHTWSQYVLFALCTSRFRLKLLKRRLKTDIFYFMRRAFKRIFDFAPFNVCQSFAQGTIVHLPSTTEDIRIIKFNCEII